VAHCDFYLSAPDISTLPQYSLTHLQVHSVHWFTKSLQQAISQEPRISFCEYLLVRIDMVVSCII